MTKLRDRPGLARTSSSGACSGGKFVVSRAGEAYDAQARGLNRKFRFTPLEIRRAT
jgi:hypothetical protein